MEIICQEFDYTKQLIQRQELFKECFPEYVDENNYNNNDYLWLYHSFPSVPKSFEYVAIFDNQILNRSSSTSS